MVLDTLQGTHSAILNDEELKLMLKEKYKQLGFTHDDFVTIYNLMLQAVDSNSGLTANQIVSLMRRFSEFRDIVVA